MQNKVYGGKDGEYLEWWDTLAYEYEPKVLSPFHQKVKNPLFTFVDSLDSREHKRAADLGCGRGGFLVFLSRHFEEVWGFDWSINMLRVARKELKGNSKVHLKRLDIRNLKNFYGYFDIVFSINAIAPADVSMAKDMLREAFSALNTHGIFVGIFPSFEAVLYQRELTYTDYIEQGFDCRDAWAKTDDYFVRQNKLDLEKGTYADDGTHIQKFFTENEIYSLLRGTSFKDVVTDKVLYPWELSKKYGYGYFPSNPEIWDWFFVAYK